jgi:radical SAM protein with 4Fe4S-binding SPASM domain
MKKDRLKPYVFKVEGAVNFALYDMLNGKFYQFSTDGSLEELRKILFEKKLIFKTNGIVPNKFPGEEMRRVHQNLHIKDLQIRLNGRGEDNCWNRQKKNGIKKSIKSEIVEQLQKKCQYIPLEIIRIEAEEEDMYLIERIITGFKCRVVELHIENIISQYKFEEYEKKSNGKKIIVIKDGRKKIKNLKTEIFKFFYTKYFNPCLGHKVAIDTDGEIKCCLWSDDILGNIETDDLKDMIIRGIFDFYWEFTKNKIEICKDCELRYICDECRVYALKKTGCINAKPDYCDYDPYKKD